WCGRKQALRPGERSEGGESDRARGGDAHGTAMAQYAHPSIDERSRHALITRSAPLLLHNHMEVEDVPVRITHLEGAMPPGLARQLLDPLDLEAFEPGVLL